MTLSAFSNSRSSFIAFAVATSFLAALCVKSEKIVQAQTTSAPRTIARASSTPAVNAKLTQNGRALLPIVVSANASELEKAAASTLAEYLKRISGAKFKVETSAATLTANTPGIALGVTARFAPTIANFKTDDPTATEDYLLRSHADGVLLIGASELAVEHAMWDLLYRLGYRQFFPGETWEVVPSEQNLSVAVNVFEHPDYYTRRFGPGYGVMGENRADFAAWNARNRMGSGIALSTSHAYGKIIREYKAEFEKHPEYLTKPGGDKFCVSNPGLQQLVTDYALKAFEKNPNLQSLSLDPSDGGNWESDSCRDAEVYKSITDRVVTLANVVAEAVTKKYPGKYIGIYAYNEHSPPPTIEVHPNVIPSIATGFIRGGYSLDQLIAGWSEKASQVGIREYYSVYKWDFDLPGRASAAKLDYITRTIPKFHGQKARFLISETSDNWAPNGLGYYLSSRLLWDTSEAARVDEIKADFLQKAFGPAREPMAEFYRLMDGSNKPLLSSDLIGRLYRQLDKALQSTQDAAIVARVHDLALYVRYVELYSQMTQVGGDARKVAFENVLRYTWHIRKTQMVHTLAVWRALARYQNVKIPAGSGYRVSAEKDPWKSGEPFTPEQIKKFISEGIANNEILDFQVVSFTNELVPATALGLKTGKRGHFNVIRLSQNFYTWVEKAPATITLKASGGHSYQDRGDAKFELYPSLEPEGNSVAEAGVVPDKVVREVQLKTSFTGLHRINVTDGAASTTISWAAGMSMTLESSLETRTNFSGRWTMYFYVPKGTKIVGGYRSAGGRLLDSDGKSVMTFGSDNNPGYWSVPVAPGQDGKMWQISSIKGSVSLMTVPPYLARSADELLLPKEVVEADAPKQ